MQRSMIGVWNAIFGMLPNFVCKETLAPFLICASRGTTIGLQYYCACSVAAKALGSEELAVKAKSETASHPSRGQNPQQKAAEHLQSWNLSTWHTHVAVKAMLAGKHRNVKPGKLKSTQRIVVQTAYLSSQTDNMVS